MNVLCRLCIVAWMSALPVSRSLGDETDRTTDPRFEMLKNLKGKWTGTASSGGTVFDERVVVTYKVSSAGSTVVETPWAGTKHEMVTVFFMDGDALVLTHYCAAGNQPRLRAAPGRDKGKLDFKFDSGTNLDPKKDAHMHDLTMEFVGPDRLKCVWHSYVNGKFSHDQTLELKREH